MKYINTFNDADAYNASKGTLLQPQLAYIREADDIRCTDTGNSANSISSNIDDPGQLDYPTLDDLID